MRSTRRIAIAALALFSISAATPPPSARAGDPSPEYRESLRRTIELRKQRRRSRSEQPVGVIYPYPMPPTLIIRHTPEVHDEIADLLRLLRQ